MVSAATTVSVSTVADDDVVIEPDVLLMLLEEGGQEEGTADLEERVNELLREALAMRRAAVRGI